MATSNSRPSSAKKTSKRSTAVKKTTKRSAAKKTSDGTAKKTSSGGSAKKASSSAAQSSSNGSRSRRAAARSEARPAARASQVAAQAAAELLELTGKGAEGVTGLERTDDGWTIHVEVVEVRRIPDTTDVLALYEVTTDAQGSLLGYRRLRRYARGVPGED